MPLIPGGKGGLSCEDTCCEGDIDTCLHCLVCNRQGFQASFSQALQRPLSHHMVWVAAIQGCMSLVGASN